MVVKITDLPGNGRQSHKFHWLKRYTFVYCAGADGNACGRKSRGDEKVLIDLEGP